MLPDEIATAFRSEINAGNKFEKSTYYAVQRRCLDAVKASGGGTARVALYCAAQLAGMLGDKLERDAVTADKEPDWSAYVDALETAIRLAESTGSAQEVLWQLSGSIGVICS